VIWLGFCGKIGKMISKRIKKLTPLLFGILFLSNLLAWLVVYELNQPQLLEVSFFDVGQGDSIFIETPSGHQILIDGGPGSAVLEKLGAEMPFWDRTIDLVILTHPEHDHISGLIEVLKGYKVENVLWTGIIRETAEYREWKECLKDERAQIIIAEAGQKIKVGEIYLNILHPSENLEGQATKSVNNTSIVIRLVFGQNSFLFIGDAFKSVERKIIERGLAINSNVLKVGHHGSKTSSAKEFIEGVFPEVAVIQAGKNNPYGHPHQETLEVLGEYDITVLRTDLDGNIKIMSNGLNYRIE